ncbi:cation-translocating P-type ATPase [Enterococcus pallens]|uniref:HAD ATPase, P-type, family IC n=1 Tax=Enterococcus pallens ATCC BAA-351 TaxID=1158607 RepID=R2SCG3_9ENTE|nr:HAD-IC family P-type ATPase [Enterococcus pallens]EOH93225.1 HAD ATPase, P-type, family IC [Enterococcus pallens ATCC BAA-351]EOU25011.1 hypothetical protein I588_00999 [Enterococcus pallens ATCC BAA-351]OJG76106.1 HAD ATPase, P-type, family IC [Enterococcus pallens]
METSLYKGLTDDEVKKHIEEGQVNNYQSTVTKSTGSIVRKNVMTLFNLLNFLLAGCLLLVKAYSNMFFILIIMVNILIGIIQEIRARNMVEKLTLISQKKVTVIRNSLLQEITPQDLVMEDLIVLEAGDQVPSDLLVIDGAAEVNESMLTGESDSIPKTIDSELLSGSYLTSGKVIAKVEHVGADNYATKIIDETKKTKPITSELMASIQKISTFTSWVIIPLGLILFLEGFFLRGSSTTMAVVTSVAALIGMLPKGLVLLISLALTTGVMKLAKRNVLVQNMYAIETLARMDTLCLDKTGTLTEGKMMVEDIYVLNEDYRYKVLDLIGSYLAASTDNNATSKALKAYFEENELYHAEELSAFSSERKYGSVRFKDFGTFYLGSPENLMKPDQLPRVMLTYQDKGMRVLLIAIDPSNQKEPTQVQPIAFIVLSDPIRKNVKEALDFFKEQEVELKIISGDHPKTVAAIAEKAGFSDFSNAIDLSGYTEEKEIQAAAHQYAVFGRVTPHQKKILVKELKDSGQTVGMTGDGVNDILALREADISIAMAEGDGATRQISDLILLDSNFVSLPQVIFEGRRVINNITRSSGVFFIKTIYSLLVTLFCILTASAFPFIPLQITLIDLAIEGYPSFFLSFEENPKKVAEHFLPSAFRYALPSGLLVTLNIALVWMLGSIGWLGSSESRTLMYYLLIGISCYAVVKSCQPFNPLRLFLSVTTTIGTFTAVLLFHSLLSIDPLSLHIVLYTAVFMIINVLLWSVLYGKTSKMKFRIMIPKRV